MNEDMDVSAESVSRVQNGNVITVKFCNVWVESECGSTYLDSVEITAIDGVQQNITFNPCEWFVISQQTGRLVSERIADLMECENE